MSPLLRIWGITAACIALLLALRGAFALALACFLLSPAPVVLFLHGGPDQRRLSLSWLATIVAVLAGLFILFAVVVYFGGIPQVHEWPGTLRGGAK
jgi:hypothetical protein